MEARTDQWLSYALANISSSDQENLHRTLVVVTSDHGMTDSGNHGGASHLEVDTTLMFAHTQVGMFWPKGVASCHTGSVGRILQISLAPTLALVFGVPVPINNVAPLIPDVFSHADAGEFAVAACMVARQISNTVQANGGPLCSLDKCQLLSSETVETFKKSCLVRDLLVQPWYADLAINSSTEDSAAERLCGQSGVAFVHAVRTSAQCSAIALSLHSAPSSLHLILSVSAAITALLVAVALLLIPQRECFGVFSAAVTAHCVCMFTTTFMEEEHMIVYFLISFLHSQALRTLVVHSASSHRVFLSASCVFSWVCCLFLRSFCSGGAKWAHLWDLRSAVSSSILLRCVLSVVSAFTFCFTAYFLRRPRLVSGIFSSAMILSTAASMHGFDQSYGRQIRCIAVVAITVASFLGVVIFLECKIQSAAFFFGGIAFLLVNPSVHAPFALAFCIIPAFVSKFLPLLSSTVQGLFVYYIALHAFFSVGMSNAVSSVDILAPFRLFENFDRWLALIITWLGAYGLPIGVALLLLCSTASAVGKPNAPSLNLVVSAFMTARIAISACLCIATVILRQHLFVWTVLAPRLMFEIANCSAALLFSLLAVKWGVAAQRTNK